MTYEEATAEVRLTTEEIEALLANLDAEGEEIATVQVGEGEVAVDPVI